MLSLPSPWSSSTHPEGHWYNLELRVLNKPLYCLEELNTVPDAEAAELVLQLDKQIAGSYRYYLTRSLYDRALTGDFRFGPFSHCQGGLYCELPLLLKNKCGSHRFFHWFFHCH